MSKGTPSAVPATTLEHAAFPHLTTIQWQALHRLAAVSGEFVVTSLLSSATPDQQRQAIQELMERELAKSKRRVITPSHSSRNDALKMETSTYSGVGQDRLPLNCWFREVDIATSSMMIEAPTASVNFLLSRLSGKAKEWALDKLVVDLNVFPLWRFSRVTSDSRSSFHRTSRACGRPSLPSGKARCPCATTFRSPATWFRASPRTRSALPLKCTSSSGCLRA
ncbi:unnamed protein product [Phytophthora fragariaefolia]|uniref:Unnamed protein product n=1 Tax=Phytophthora fragariaefolia TaxID=1490495 RepID=A0A9W6U797_9STRA|nr:unnamed protein product [Phytophthora fragariaefolia]